MSRGNGKTPYKLIDQPRADSKNHPDSVVRRTTRYSSQWTYSELTLCHAGK
jgi:hypothetical protein